MLYLRNYGFALPVLSLETCAMSYCRVAELVTGGVLIGSLVLLTAIGLGVLLTSKAEMRGSPREVLRRCAKSGSGYFFLIMARRYLYRLRWLLGGVAIGSIFILSQIRCQSGWA